ncbi:MAG: hypothetical protein Q8Q35_00595 [Nanoarchaeota archaeon]|nr:hypothetical protein [Nanoarchaeota archaeon]
MVISRLYIIMSIVILLIIGLIIFFLNKNKKDKKLTPLAGFALGCFLIGIFFIENRLVGYGFIGIGLVLAIIDIILKNKKK